MKLFNEWFPSWSEDERARFVRSLKELDPQFGDNLESELAGTRIVESGMPDYIQEFIEQNANNEAKEEDSAIKTSDHQDETTTESSLGSSLNLEDSGINYEETQNSSPIEIAATS